MKTPLVPSFALASLAFLLPPAQAAPRILETVVSEAILLRDRGEAPVIVSDLDETVIDSSPRRAAALARAFAKLCAPADAPAECVAHPELGADQTALIRGTLNTYDMRLFLKGLGVPPSPFTARLDSAAVEEYLSGRLIERDVAIAGASEWVRRLKRAGAVVYFVSSRFDDTQREGTLASLRALGLLEDGEDPSRVILRPRGMSSIDFKKEAFGKLRGERVLAALENEPENMAAMAEAFPGAHAIFVQGAWLLDGVLPATVSRIATFE